MSSALKRVLQYSGFWDDSLDLKEITFIYGAPDDKQSGEAQLIPFTISFVAAYLFAFSYHDQGHNLANVLPLACPRAFIAGEWKRAKL